MDPITSLAATNRTRSFWLTREITSVLIPGLVLSLEILALFSPNVYIINKLNSVRDSDAVTFALLIVGVAAAWLLGYAAREVGFRFFVWITEPRVDSSAHSWMMKALSRLSRFPRLKNDYERIRSPQPTVTDLMGRLREAHGTRAVDAFLTAHPLLRHAAQSGGPLSTPFVRGGGGHLRDGSTWVFSYCKHWLRRNSPVTGVDDIEIEINIAVGAMLPALLFTPAVNAILQGNRLAIVTIPTIVSILIAQELLRSFRRLRGSERWDALFRTFEDWAMSHAEIARATNANTDGEGSPEPGTRAPSEP